MKESMWGYLIVLLGLVIVVIIFLVSNLTNTNEQDYFLAREILKNSMYDAIDYGTYMKSGKVVMSREKFVSIFTRRFAESVNNDRTFTLEFYDIYEYPPKATVRIKTETGTAAVKSDAVNIEINTFLSGILETSVSRGDYSVIFKSVLGDCNADGNYSNDDLPLIEAYFNNTGDCKIPEAKNKAYTIYDVLDINKDEKINEVDLILLKKYLYRGVPLDVNGDGEFDSQDKDLVTNGCKNTGSAISGGSEFYKKDCEGLTPRQMVVADVNCNGYVDDLDVEVLTTCLEKDLCYIEDANLDNVIDDKDLKIINNCLSDGKCLHTYWKKREYLFY